MTKTYFFFGESGPRGESVLFVLLLFLAKLNAQSSPIDYPQSAFDSDTCCWRELSASKEYEVAARVLTEYLEHGPVQNKHSLRWHAGQMYAMAGENRKALKFFRSTSNILYRWFGDEDGKAWYYYVKGTKAFLKRDQGALDTVIRKWNAELPEEDNLKVLKNLQGNWDLPYRDAYHAS